MDFLDFDHGGGGGSGGKRKGSSWEQSKIPSQWESDVVGAAAAVPTCGWQFAAAAAAAWHKLMEMNVKFYFILYLFNYFTCSLTHRIHV